jgi:hypothetical protein
MRFFPLPLLLLLCACGTSPNVIGMPYNEFVMNYGPPSLETKVDGKRACSWWVKRGIYVDKIVSVFDENDLCIRFSRN